MKPAPEVVPSGVPGPDYQAAQEGAAVLVRTDRRFLRVEGKAPGEMLKGVVTGRIPSLRPSADLPLCRRELSYSALLTPKGKLVTDLRIYGPAADSPFFFLELPSAGFKAAQDLFGRVMPPRLARVEVVDPQPVFLTLAGPRAATLLGAWLAEYGGSGGGWGGPGELEGSLRELEEGETLWFSFPGGGGLLVALDLHRPDLAWDLAVFAHSPGEHLLTRLLEGGALPLSPDTWAVLEVEGGRPVFGHDMNQDTLPMEAGIQERAIDHTKGCYTGQEVVVRVRDRGHVNRRLVGLLLGDQPLPPRGSYLFRPSEAKEVGWITRAVWSPAFRQGAALGYLRREVRAGEKVRAIHPQGAPAKVVELGPLGWRLSDGDNPGPAEA